MNKTLITGASSGIGAAYALEYAKRKHDLVLTGRRKEKLEKIAQQCRDISDIKVETKIVEFTDPQQIDQLSKFVQQQKISVLINNAGFGHNQAFHDDTLKNQTDMIDVHITAAVKLIHAAIPYMREQKKGTIINVASVAGHLFGPGAGMYCSTKAFLVAFSEILYMEHHKQGIKVQALCPGFTHTDFHEKVGLSEEQKLRRIRLPWMSCEAVIKTSIKCLKKNVVVCVPGFFYWFMVKTVPRLPRGVFYWLMEFFNTKDIFKEV